MAVEQEDASLLSAHALALGKIVINMQALETMLAFFTWSLMEAGQDVGPAVTSMLSFRRLCDLFLILAAKKVQDERLLDEFTDLVSGMARVEEKRNTFVHSAYLSNEETGEVSRLKVTAKRREGVQADVPSVDDGELTAVAKEIRGLSDRLGKLMARAREIGFVAFPTGPQEPLA